MKKGTVRTVSILFSGAWLITQAAEINFNVCHSGNATHRVVYLFVHGLAATQKQVFRLYTQERAASKKNKNPKDNTNWIVTEPIALFDFPDAKCDGDYHRKDVNLGQNPDLERLDTAYQLTLKEFPEHEIVLVGVSRGAATIVNYVAKYNPPQLAAVVVESPFDTLSSIIKHLLKRFKVNWIPFSKTLGHKIVRTHFPRLEPDGIFPIHVVEKISPTVPIMIIHGYKDNVIPITSSRRLYIKLKEIGHKDAYLVELKSGAHAQLVHGSDAQFYHILVHAFYKKYGLPHDPEKARLGEPFLDLAQPSTSEVALRIKRKRSIEREEEQEDELDANLLALLKQKA